MGEDQANDYLKYIMKAFYKFDDAKDELMEGKNVDCDSQIKALKSSIKSWNWKTRKEQYKKALDERPERPERTPDAPLPKLCGNFNYQKDTGKDAVPADLI